MATPNLVNIATITPFTIAGAVTTSNVDIIDVASNKTRKINSIIISNVDVVTQRLFLFLSLLIMAQTIITWQKL